MNQAAPFHLLAVVAVLLLALSLRVLDIFVFRLDERWGEILVSKSLTFVLVLGVVLVSGRGPQAIGLRGGEPAAPLLVASLGMIAVCALAVALQLLALRLRGEPAALAFAAIDPKTGLAGGLDFALLLVIGNVVNALAEEGLFRGLLQPALEPALGPWRAIAVQALLFGAWHLVWPVKSLWTGEADAVLAFGAGLALFVGSSIAGFAFGWMYALTQTLWVPIAVHFLNNSFYNFVHVRSAAGMDKDVLVVQGVATVGLLALAAVLRVAAR